ncbi:hypothetical protein EVAR_39787_1 [Eumeta japonica]|uniref:Uncharacterized protein n=1 Tax=Eumeta variegata TaxID=151549 RepID=A0A4C1X4L0_EUMVA|nr:hypothetical protein EVAR_39787_1 [Eumeta japonica]
MAVVARAHRRSFFHESAGDCGRAHCRVPPPRAAVGRGPSPIAILRMTGFDTIRYVVKSAERKDKIMRRRLRSRAYVRVHPPLRGVALCE